MTKILHLSSSARTTESTSRAAASVLMQRWPNAETNQRDLNSPLPQIDETWVTARLVDSTDRTPDQNAALAQSDDLIAELQATDILVISTALYNFGVPASLKAWMDLVARPRVTFKYTDDGPMGLLHNMEAHVILASGGIAMNAPDDFATPHLRRFLKFIGITNVTEHAAKDLAPGA